MDECTSGPPIQVSQDRIGTGQEVRGQSGRKGRDKGQHRGWSRGQVGPDGTRNPHPSIVPGNILKI